jgi:hypothetical protein
LQNVIRDFKNSASKKLIEAIKEHPESRREWLLRNLVLKLKKQEGLQYKLWKDGFHPFLWILWKKLSSDNYIL